MKSVAITVTVSEEVDVERYNRAFRALCAYVQQDDEIVLSSNGAVISRQFSVNASAMTGGLFGFLEGLRITDTIIEYAVRTVDYTA